MLTPSTDSQWQESRFFSSPRDSSGPAGQSSPVFRANQQQRNRQKLVERDRKKQEAIVHRSNPTEARDRVPRYKSAQTVQGIILVSTHELPDRLRNVFPFPVFNAVQSRCYDSIFNTDDNFVLSSPTGSGKTAVFELAICRAIKQFKNEEFKVVYQAPTKALCSERKEDWTNKFRHLDCKCEELTGDSDHWQMKNVQEATIIVTTPEKWDSITRKWKDHMKLMKMIKLFLIDEVHILREDRGATLEAIVSRTKSVDSSVRFIAVSATVPNVEDIAEWLGRSSNRSREPALLEKFGEEFRPVKLQKHVIGYDMKSSNEFAFSKFLDKNRYSQRKPIMVFCFTRRSCEETAKALASWWAGSGLNNRHWDGPKEVVKSKLQGLRDCLTSGVAYHHAGLDLDDRRAVAKGYMNGNINVICCTSTLAVGINLPCHFVVLKGTASYSNNVIRDYSDIEVMQMLGRAGRPQFDDSAVAVIMCRPGQVGRYQKMVSGQEILESCLHRNLIEHLNAEVGLGTITDIASAKRWLTGTFLYVRLKKNPTYYKLKDGARINNLDELLDEILSKDIQQLQELGLVETEPRYKATEYGDAMARYYVLFDTMKSILQLPTKAKVSDILSAIAQASEFREIRFRSGEKQFYKAVNKLPLIRFPIPVNLDMPAHKVSLIIQSILGAIDTQSLPDNKLHAHQFTVDKAIIFQNVRRMIRCVVDCKLHIDDSISARNALAFSRSLAAEVWDDSPNILKQLDGVGNVAVRKLVNGGIKDFETLDQTPAHRIEMIMSRNPPYGQRMLDKAKLFPKLRVCLQMNGAPSIKRGEGASINVRAEIGFMNDIVPATFNRQSVFICFLAETSDGQKIHFCRISAKHLDAGKDVLFCANLTSTTQMIFAHVMCDEQAGTLRTASLKPTLPAHAFHLVEKKSDQRDIRGMMQSQEAEKKSNNLFPNEVPAEELDDADFDWDDFDAAAAAVNDFQDIDDLIAEGPEKRSQQQKVSFFAAPDTSEPKEPKKLPSGKWECNHPCKDKAKCRHLCCKEGVDKPPK
ncbi:P-loop containing nucleoside triphosphate hydrolase protein, partial [Eremomyces bilateralis CBS 781.70]